MARFLIICGVALLATGGVAAGRNDVRHGRAAHTRRGDGAVTLSGVVVDQNGDPIPGSPGGGSGVLLYNGPSGNTFADLAADGSFSITVAPGHYDLDLRLDQVPGLPGDVTIGTSIDLDASQTQTFTVPVYHLSATVSDSDGNPVEN